MVRQTLQVVLAIVYSIAVHVLAFWLSILTCVVPFGKPALLIVVPLWFVFFFCAGWAVQKRTQDFQFANAAFAAMLALLFFPFIDYLNHGQLTDAAVEMYFVVSPVVFGSIAGVAMARRWKRQTRNS